MKMAHAYANQKPLSDDEIQEVVNKTYGKGFGIIAFVRAIEKAHGIGE